MRKSLLETFDKIYVLDLHGNSRIHETSPDGSVDQNVFDIMQGVSINIFVKTGNKKKNSLGKVYHFELFGKRDIKYQTLSELNFKQIKWNELPLDKQYNFFVPKDFGLEKKYNSGFKINETLINNNTGIQTKCDDLSIHFQKEDLLKVIENFKNLEVEELKRIYSNKKDSSGWNFKNAKADLVDNKIHFSKILYRPFDIRHTLYTGKSSGFIGRPRTSTMKHLIKPDNIGLITLRINGENDEFVSLITKNIIEKGSLPRGNYSVFPLYLYPENEQQVIEQNKFRVPNLNPDFLKLLSEQLKLPFTNEDDFTYDSIAPINILDYIYAVLHSPTYREKYKVFLKIDFPRVPYPKDQAIFWQLVKLGSELRQIHLLESPIVDKYITQYPIDGDNVVQKPTYTDRKVYINDTQYFDSVPETAWNFYIGGYQPAQKWLKDRKNRELNFEDILHYQKIIVALTETDRLMKEIDEIEFE
jgi:predicted helicase